MNSEVDRRGKLDEQPFDYQITKDGRVFISWNRKRVSGAVDHAAAKLIALLLRLDEQGDEANIQLALAKVTGNFKRGNERPSKH
ncbi:MAG: hypothetical protein ACYDBJ_26295 [Aggregatilineales bacterium]